ncbi:MAG: bifunctional hydroxymethylpyrimidine kinase/phosphomethylpyrimidine kinase [Candidatus Omnitrophica bacterium]|nr:bifunctional hydroxymethylpyrimidine kinase/phosphomethylpyrimidine kinase [Candidatus Omnitrophota bacterium]
MSILVVGSVALDSVETPFGKKKEILGGSATFFSITASFFNKVNIVAAVGEDFPKKYVTLLKSRSVGIDGLTVSKGKTFRWVGRYDYDLNTAHTIATHLNVFKDFNPHIPRHLRQPEFLFLANIDPDLQYNVLTQVKRPKLVACDSMNYWISTKRKSLEKLLDRIDIILLNDAEARQFSGESNLIKAAQQIIAFGPKAVIIKRGEHGVLYFSKDAHFIAPAYLLETIYDPTGAGDTFAGGMMGYISRAKTINDLTIRKSIIYGSIMASFTVEDFSVNRLLEISKKDISGRFDHYRKITRF